MLYPVPFPDQYGARTGSSLQNSLLRAIADAVKDSLGGRLETAKRSLLEPIGNRSYHQHSTKARRWIKPEERGPFPSKRGQLDSRELADFLRQLF